MNIIRTTWLWVRGLAGAWQIAGTIVLAVAAMGVLVFAKRVAYTRAQNGGNGRTVKTAGYVLAIVLGVFALVGMAAVFAPLIGF